METNRRWAEGLSSRHRSRIFKLHGDEVGGAGRMRRAFMRSFGQPPQAIRRAAARR
jgi:hypothetical protein